MTKRNTTTTTAPAAGNVVAFKGRKAAAAPAAAAPASVAKPARTRKPAAAPVTAPAAAPAKPARKPAARKPAAPAIKPCDKGAAFDAHVAAFAVHALSSQVKPIAAKAVAAKAAVSVAVPAPAAARVVRVTVTDHGNFDVAAPLDSARLTEFVRTHIAPRLAAYFEVTDLSVTTCGKIGPDFFRAAFAFGDKGAKRASVAFGLIAADTPNPRPLAPRAGMPRRRADELAAAIGKAPDTAPSAAPAARAAAPAAASSAAPARVSGATAAILADAAKGKLPALPDFSAPTHTRYRARLAEIHAMVKAGDIAGLKSAVINPISTSPKAINRYRNAAVIALEVKAAKAASKAAR